MNNKRFYQYVIVNQETCFAEVVELCRGWYSSSDEVELEYKDKYNFKEHLFSARKLDFTCVPFSTYKVL